jgi:hypothetical protein
MQSELKRMWNCSRKLNNLRFSLFSANIRKSGNETTIIVVFVRLFCPGINLELKTGFWHKVLYPAP